MDAAALRQRAWVLTLRSIQAWDRLRLPLLRARHGGLELHPTASASFAVARFNLAPDARVRIGPRVVTERIPGALHFFAESDAEIVVEEGAWLRTELGPISLVAFSGARLRVGPDALLNGCHVSAKRSVELGRRAFVGPGTRIFDADQHDFDAERAERFGPVRIGDHTWIASDATILRGVTIGDHSVVGARSLVTSDVPPHTLAYGAPARLHGPVGDRSKAS